MHQERQRPVNSLPVIISPLNKEGLRGTWGSLLVGSIFFIVFSGMISTAHAGQATLTWNPPTTNTDGTPLTDLAAYKVYYGTASGSYTTTVDVGNVTSYTVTGLNNNATYYFATTAYDTSGNESGYSNEVSKTISGTSDTTPPVLSGVTTSNITSTSAAITWTTDEASTSQAEYGTTTSYGSSTTIDSTMVTSHSVTINGLSAWTTYHFRVKSQDAAGNLATSSDYTFTTIAPPDTTAPTGTISINSGASSTTSTSVTLTLSCSDAGSGCSQMRLSNNGTTWNAWESYATSKAWTLSTTDGVKTVYIQYRDTNSNTSQSYTDTITLDTTAPTMSGIGTTNLTASGVSISWTTSEGATTQVEYGTTTSYGSSTTLDTNLVTSHTVSLSSLSGSTTYHYRVKSQDAAGNLATSGDYTFTTAASPDTTPPVTSNIVISNITTSEATITWTTDEVATSQVEYGTSTLYGNFSNQDNSLAISHTITLSGLTPDTIYYFRVISIDQSGNNGTSPDYNFTTLKAAQPDTPAAIQDLTVRVGASSRNSVILDWTATGADGVEGTASTYDLRMSTQKIIEDGITPVQGESNFSTAVRIINGMPAPMVAGTPESVQVDLLETNSVYYFAIKAIDDKGNISAISPVVNGAALPPVPVTAVRQGYTMISVPLVPPTSDVQTLFGGIMGTPVELYWWSSNGPGDNDGAFVAETNIVPGYGYFLKSNTDNAILNITGTEVTDPSRVIPLQPGWNMIGNPYPKEVALRNTYIRKIDTGELKSYEDAVTAGWVGNSMYSYNGSTYDFMSYTDTILKLWQGYWLTVFQNGQYEMIIYKP